MVVPAAGAVPLTNESVICPAELMARLQVLPPVTKVCVRVADGLHPPLMVAIVAGPLHELTNVNTM